MLQMPRLSPFSTDRLPVVALKIGGKVYEPKSYTLDSNVLTLVDAFSATLANIDGELTHPKDGSAPIAIGDRVTVTMADPQVAGGAEVTKLKGIIVGLDAMSDTTGGSVVQVQGADLGWHLENTCGTLWRRLNGLTFDKLLAAVLDASWGFEGVRSQNDTSRHLSQGRAAVIAARAAPGTIIPPIQFEPGQTIGETLRLYAKRERYLVNVSPDGYLQIFRPNYTQAVSYGVRYYRATDSRRDQNNVKAPIRVTRKIDGLYSDVICVGTSVNPLALPTPERPNEGQFRGRYNTDTTLPFARLWTFSDGEPLTVAKANDRARWFHQRGRFDSFTAEYTLTGHSQGGLFFETDTLCSVDDDVHGLHGKYYVTGRTYRRDSSGTTTTLTLHEPNLLGA